MSLPLLVRKEGNLVIQDKYQNAVESGYFAPTSGEGPFAYREEVQILTACPRPDSLFASDIIEKRCRR
jgi:hypothetical protein